jgi:hypothetical protein
LLRLVEAAVDLVEVEAAAQADIEHPQEHLVVVHLLKTH